MDPLQSTLAILDYAAVFVFAATGALAAARRKHDLVTFGFFAAITGVGGGTLRDLLLDAPVFWVAQPAYLAISLMAGLAVWVLGDRGFRAPLLLWLDAIGMAAYAVVGAAKATALGAPPLPAIVMGVLTATCGGIIRDVVAEEPSVLLRREIYVTAALLGAVVFVGLQLAGAAALPAGLIGFSAALALRAGAIVFNWSLPGFPGRKDAAE